mgnify:CR=1 FL=1
MQRGLTKNIAVITTDLRAFPVIETFWEQYPFYIEVKTPITFINSDLEIEDVFKGDFIVWKGDKEFRGMKKSTWNKLYGDYLKENISKKGELKWE